MFFLYFLLMFLILFLLSFFFFFNDTATTEIYTLSLHDALPILPMSTTGALFACPQPVLSCGRDRKSTRLNSSHTVISYAVFCLKKKKHTKIYRHKQKQNRTHIKKNIIM